jgi:hypothetical protein
MKALVYRNTKTTLPNWATPLHDDQPRGIAYETANHFVHIYGGGEGLWIISLGLTVTEKKSGLLRDWVERVFGADGIEESVNEVGRTVEGVWRPGLLIEQEILQGLGNTDIERRLAEQALRILVQRLDEILTYIEPTRDGLKTFGHKTRELLILACTEVENIWKNYMNRVGATPAGRDFTTSDYVRLSRPLYLSEFEVSLPLYLDVQAIKPFYGWDALRSTQSLPWYDAYNKTKHDRSTHFNLASVENCISAVAAAVVLFCVRFSPFPLVNGQSTLATLSHQIFSIRLDGYLPNSCYVPLIVPPPNQAERLVCFNSQGSKLVQARVVEPLTL